MRLPLGVNRQGRLLRVRERRAELLGPNPTTNLVGHKQEQIY